MKKRIFFTTLSIFFVFLFSFKKYNYIKPKQYNYDVKIYRDKWGVPHIFGDTDSDVAYGLGYAHSEDDFETIQKILLATRGELASVIGKEGVPSDYLVNLLKIWETVDNKHINELSPQIIEICNSYANGVNRYIELNPDKLLLGGLYPVKGKDIIAGFIYRTPLMFELDWYIKKILNEDLSEINTHETMGTHNRVISLGSCYLEVISLDPKNQNANNNTWFNLSDKNYSEKFIKNPKLISFVISSKEFNS